MRDQEPALNLTACHLRHVRWSWPEIACDRCGRPAPRAWEAERVAVDIDLDRPVLLLVQVSVHRCAARRHHFRAQPPFLRPDASYTNRVVDKAVQSVVADGMAFRRVAARLARDFWVRPSEKMVRLWCRRYAASFDVERDYQPWVVGQFSGILCVDEVYQDRLALLLAVDPAAPEGDRLVGYQLVHRAKVEPADLERFLERLKRAGIAPDQLITDGSTLYPPLVAAVWPQAAPQLCLFHQTRLVTEAAKQVLKAAFAELPAIPRTAAGAGGGSPAADTGSDRRPTGDPAARPAERRGRLYPHQQAAGRRLAHHLHAQGQTISAIARRAGVTRLTVRRWLRQPPPAPPGEGAAPLPERIDRTLPPPAPPAPWRGWEQVRRARQALGPDRLRLVRHPTRLTAEDRAALADLLDGPVGEPVRRARAFLDDWDAIWRDERGQKRGSAEARRRYEGWQTSAEYRGLAPLAGMQRRCDADQFAKLSRFLERPEWEGTNNGAERMGRWVRHRQAPHFGLRTAAAVEDALAVHALRAKAASAGRPEPAGRSQRGRRPSHRN